MLLLRDQDKEVWRYKIKRKQGEGISNSIRIDERGDVFAVKFGKSLGGSDFFDTDGKLDSSKIMVFKSSDGGILVEVPITAADSISAIQDFAVSRDGKSLVIVDDGHLRLVPITDSHSGKPADPIPERVNNFETPQF